MKTGFYSSVWFAGGALVLMLAMDVYEWTPGDQLAPADLAINLVSDLMGAVAILFGSLVGMTSRAAERAVPRIHLLALGVVFALCWSFIARPMFLLGGVAAVLAVSAVLAALVTNLGVRVLGKRAA